MSAISLASRTKRSRWVGSDPEPPLAKTSPATRSGWRIV
jgi:hypothetical protein